MFPREDFISQLQLSMALVVIMKSPCTSMARSSLPPTMASKIGSLLDMLMELVSLVAFLMVKELDYGIAKIHTRVVPLEPR